MELGFSFPALCRRREGLSHTTSHCCAVREVLDTPELDCSQLRWDLPAPPDSHSSRGLWWEGGRRRGCLAWNVSLLQTSPPLGSPLHPDAGSAEQERREEGRESPPDASYSPETWEGSASPQPVWPKFDPRSLSSKEWSSKNTSSRKN